MIPIQVAAASAAPAVQMTTVPNPHATPIVLQAPPVQQPLAQMTWFQAHASWLTHTVAGIFIVAAIALVVLLAVQTTKQEGLSGSIGGRVESAYHGRLGADEQLQRITGFVAVAFVVTAFILSLTGI
ncbi:MAG TPA: preprotein translocase subunit SecG [Candidatus Baltobacteraceae bacterium]|nr:preprotein translocase subunit SecG [Candidatus Baltobacteraceae bacterium]